MTLIEKLGELSFLELRDGRLHSEMGEDVTDELLGVLAEQPKHPEGWKLVPVEPTPEMIHAVRFAGDPDRPAIGERIKAGETAYPFVGGDVALRMCRAMLNAAPQPAQPAQQEPVAERFEAMHAKGDVWITTIAAAAIARSTSPQPSKPLTDEEIKLVMNGRGEEGDDDYVKPAFDPFGISEEDLMNFARAIEAAHGIKGDA